MNPAAAGLVIGSPAGTGRGAEGGVNDLYRYLDGRLVPQDDTCRLDRPPFRRAVSELDTLGQRSGTDRHLWQRNAQGLLKDAQPETSGVQQDVGNYLAG